MAESCDALFERTSVVEEAVKYLREIEQINHDLGGESVVGRRMVDNQYCFRGSNGKGLELTEKGICGFRERKKKRLGLRLEDGEDEEFMKKREKELDQQLESVHAHIDRLEAAQAEVQGLRQLALEKLKGIESREQSLRTERVALVEKERKIEERDKETNEKRGEIIRYLDLRLTAVEEREKACVLKKRELVEMEKELNKKKEEFVKEQDKLRNGVVDRLGMAEKKLEGVSAMIDERLREIEVREKVACESVAVMVKEADSIREMVENRIEEFEEMIGEFRKKEKNVISRKNEHDKRIRNKEKNVISRKNELLMKEQKLELKEKYLRVWKKELKVERRELSLAQKLNEQRLDEIEQREKNLKSVRDFTSNWFKEHRAVREKLRSEMNLAEQRARDLQVKNQQLESMIRELESTGKQTSDRRKNLKLKQLGHIEVPDDHEKTDADESADLRFFVRMDGKTLQKFLNDPQKDLESVGDEVFTVLHLSSDPAKLVLDAMAGFYPPHLREDDVETNVRKTCIVLLEQLIRLSRKIQPSVREEAIELASAWKSKMRATSENQLEVLGFLHLVAAYDIASCFEKDDISSLLKMVDQHRQTPELCRILGAAKSIGELTDENVKTYSKTRGEEDLNLWDYIEDIET